jgi:hypothetical protein
MDLIPLGDVELRYVTLEALDYGAGGQFYGTMEGTIAGDRLRGTLRLTNLAPRPPDVAQVQSDQAANPSD